ncbi:hypothetical protein MtrunA17_Chr1g0160191 [Medicago truncatula]|uniref:Uncharacterized protein n=1 Tax=Medicago truncatula TaxID=3880 RepID=A0A396JL78_MEDTR|nr:hypothetical protein MtrunA17_Chr1g0160191 [Medicago truncatula]
MTLDFDGLFGISFKFIAKCNIMLTGVGKRHDQHYLLRDLVRKIRK